MRTPPPSVRSLVSRLRAAGQTVADPQGDEAIAVIENLRTSLTLFAGAEGFASLLRRALVLASANVPSLQNVTVGAHGRLEGIERLPVEIRTGAMVVVAEHLLDLLVTFIGESLTLKLVCEAWPDISVDDDQSRSEEG